MKIGKRVPLLIRGKPRILVIGEAPGPRGASVTGYPFWGDACGEQVYRLLHALQLLAQPKFKPGTGTDAPPGGHYAITNAVDQMPWNEAAGKFRSPTYQEVTDQAPRLARDVKEAGAEVILTLGAAATRALGLAMECEPFLRGMPQKAAVQHCIDYAGVPLTNGYVAFATFHPSYSYWKRFPDLHGKIVLQIKHRIR